MLLFTHVCCVL